MPVLLVAGPKVWMMLRKACSKHMQVCSSSVKLISNRQPGKNGECERPFTCIQLPGSWGTTHDEEKKIAPQAVMPGGAILISHQDAVSGIASWHEQPGN